MKEKPRDIVVVGAGNLGMLVYDCLAGDERWRCIGFIDDGKAGSIQFDLPVFGSRDYDPTFCRTVLLAVGFPKTRREMVGRLAHLDLDWPTFIDRRGLVGSGASLGKGALVLSFAMVASGVRLGEFSYVSSYAHAGTGAVIGEYTSLMGGATVGASVVGNDCTIGLKSSCLDGASIGDGATVAPHTLVRRPVPPGVLIAGSPARVISRDATVKD